MDSSKSVVLLVDESRRHHVMAVGGYITTADQLVGIANSWRRLKEDTLGIDPRAELKHSMDADDPARLAMEAQGWNQATRVPEMLRQIAGMDLRVLVDVMVDVRTDVRPEQLYLDGLGWCLRRAANDASVDTDGPHWTIVDMPPRVKAVDSDVAPRLRDLHKNIGTAAFDHYQRLYLEPQAFGGGAGNVPLRDVGFVPTLVAAHARHSDLLQVADVLVGTVGDYVTECLKTKGLSEDDYREGNLRLISPMFRRGPIGQIGGYGFGLFPPSEPGVPAIKNRVEYVCELS